ncbi:hypothetical protein H9Y04_22620 [Streptomyces sp. TRM66268-LWL]|uniref:Uncharacterized protein n=1 Tax=Streptomyces polyasparticus TaxID=2767826 RepID=A0ABR7SL79_9ACTN|nr:hypothetical protein [Streptomyces polyasparticus]MBC9715347.1 hypothetical protein [Streptomyces polyasparticus]
MEWITLAATCLGALIGVGSTLLAERLRASREESQRRQGLRQQLYADFLAALSRVADDLYALASSPDRNELPVRASEAWRRGDSYPLRYHMTISAPAGMVTASDACFRRLRDFRDVVANGAVSGTPEFRAAQAAYDQSLTRLRELMRTDLGLAG